MEQKTFLAIVLSFLFLLSYNALVIAPTHRINIPKTIDNESVTDSSTSSNQRTEATKDLLPKKSDINVSQLAFPIEYETFKIEFSNNGGIKKLLAKPYQYDPPLTNILSTFESTSAPQQFGQMTRLLSRGTDIEVSSTYEVVNKNKLIAQLTYKNTTKLSILKNVQFNLFTIDMSTMRFDPNRMRESSLFEYSISLDNKVHRKGNAFKFSSKENKAELKHLDWAGWRDRYHFFLVKPNFQNLGYSVDAINEHQLSIVLTSNLNLEPGQEKKFEFTIYVGPQDLSLLKSLDGKISSIMAFSNWFFLDFIEKFIYNCLLFIHNLLPNWGVCIILISILIYSATYPLTLKSMLSMRKMQQLQPKMTELRERYKNNPQKLNAEVVQLYKTYQVNPLSGCLPVLLQMPVFISLYQVLWRTQNFQGAKFLWIKDLSQPDRLFTFSANLPFVGQEFNLLPLLMTIVMFFQQKLSSKNTVATDEHQIMQQKMMVFIMPIFIGGIFYHFASGLTLYFTIFYLLSTLAQWKMSKINSAK
jgi:YidC/Oxa1 family membrane protein insertase